MKKNQIVGLVVVLIIIVAAVVAVTTHSNKSNTAIKTDNDSNSSTSTPSSVATNAVTIQNYMFGPSAIKVKAGTTVTWTNKDAVSHTVTADNPSNNAPSSMDIAQGKSYSYTFKTAGTYTYHCFPHPYMHGTVIVTN